MFFSIFNEKFLDNLLIEPCPTENLSRRENLEIPARTKISLTRERQVYPKEKEINKLNFTRKNPESISERISRNSRGR